MSTIIISTPIFFFSGFFCLYFLLFFGGRCQNCHPSHVHVEENGDKCAHHDMSVKTQQAGFHFLQWKLLLAESGPADSLLLCLQQA